MKKKSGCLANAVDQLSRRAPESNVNQLIQIEDRLDEISRAIVASSVSTPKGVDTAAFERLEARLASLNTRIDEIASSDRTADLHKRIGFLSSQIESIASRTGAPIEQMDRMTSQMEVIASKINELDRTKADPAAIASGLEDRLYAIAASLEKNHEQSGREAREIFNELEVRLQDMAGRLNSMDAVTQPIDNTDHILAAVEQRFADLSRQLASNQPEFSVDPVFAANVENRLETITRRLNETAAAAPSGDSDALARLEIQVQNLAAQLSAPREEFDPYAALNPRLEAIEQSLSMSQDAIISAARQAAEDVLSQARFSTNAADAEMASMLANDLKALETLTRKSDERNTKTFEAIHDTLLKIVDRLNSVETTKPAPFDLPQEVPFLSPAPVAAAQTEYTPAFAEPVISEPVMPTAPAPKLDLGSSAPSFAGPDLAENDEEFEDFSPINVRSPAQAALAAAQAARDGSAEIGVPQTSKSKGGFLSGLTAKMRRKEPAKGDLQLAGSSLPKAEPVLEEPLDPSQANSLIEPGSGTPDLNAIMKRVRDERRVRADGTNASDDVAKDDFLAAARRAAQAAAADAEILRNKSAKSAKKSEGGITALIQSQRKPIMMIAFAALLALTGLQLKKAFYGSDVETAAITESVLVPAETQTADIAQPKAASADTTTQVTAEIEPVEGKDVRQVDAAQSSTPSAQPDTAQKVTAPEAVASASTGAPVATDTSGPSQAIEANAPVKADLPPVEYGPIALREAAASGDAKAQFEIASRLADGTGVTKDLKKASEWYSKSADQGFAPAQFRLGSFYEKGIGVERSAQKAKENYQLAAEQGNASAMHNLAVLYAMGAAGPVDNDSAAKWFVKAAELGVKDSQYNLGILAAKGLGVAQNLEDSYKWFALAAKAGDKDAASKRDEIANAMRPEQLAKARGATELWKAKPVDPASNSVEVPSSWKTDGGTTTSTGGADPEQMAKAIRNIQAILNSQGYDAGAPDGKLGGKTQKAIIAYQKANGMAATGEVDEVLIKSLLDKVKKPKA